MIPKIIHIIWWQGIDKIPNKFQLNINSWKKNNKDYKIIIWDANTIKKFVKESYKEEWNNVKTYKYMIQKIDYCKYLILYYYGGIYIDIDIYCNDNLDKYLEQDKINVAYMPLIKFYKLINNGFIAVNKKNKIILKVIKKCKQELNNNYINKEITVFKTTGPYMFNSILSNCKNINIFDQNIIYEIDNPNLNDNIKNGKLGVHCHEFSWINKYFIFMINVIMFINRNFYKVTFIGLLLLFIFYKVFVNYLPNRLFLL